MTSPVNINQNNLPLLSHLVELRQRLIVAFSLLVLFFGLFYGIKQPLFDFLTAPLLKSLGQGGKMIFTSVPEMFFTYIKLCFISSLFVVLPFFLWQLWCFIAPGLYKQEAKVIAPFLVATPVLFYCGGLFSYFIIMPIVTEFFFSFQNETVTALPSVKEYLNFFIKMTFAFGLSFELPVLLLLLAKAGVITAKMLASKRRYAIVIIVAVGALLTPPDPASQLLLALPLYLLYEISIIGIKFMAQKVE